jgi:ATP-dependent Clp protease ATP-binding subunit ClpA
MNGSAWVGRLGIIIALTIIAKASSALAWFLVGASGLAAIGFLLFEGSFFPRFIMDPLERLTRKRDLLDTFEAKSNKLTIIDDKQLAETLKSKVIGQNAVIASLATRLRQRLAARRPNKPIAVMCFAGAPGIGKTYLAKVLAEQLYGSSKHLQMIEMAQYDQPHAAATLFGSPKGYIGSNEPGQIPKALRDVPNSIILLDEFEKAHRDIHKRFLSAWNDGFVTELSDGSKYSTNEAIFILTVNAGARRIAEFARDPNVTQDELNKFAKNALQDAQFAPEVLSRIDDVFAFRELAGLDIARVVALEMERKTQEYQLEIAGEGIDPDILYKAIESFTAKKPDGGVREIARHIEDLIADGLIEAKSNGATQVEFVADGENVKVVAIDLPNSIEQGALQSSQRLRTP